MRCRWAHIGHESGSLSRARSTAGVPLDVEIERPSSGRPSAMPLKRAPRVSRRSLAYSSTLGMTDLVLEIGREVATIAALQPGNHPVSSGEHAPAPPRAAPAARGS